ncbi:unnamed protein product, partial [Polarella glacialis]
ALRDDPIALSTFDLKCSQNQQASKYEHSPGGLVDSVEVQRLLTPSNCMVGMFSYTLICALVEQTTHSMLGSLGFDMAMEYLKLIEGCLDESPWPFTVSEVVANSERAQEIWYSGDATAATLYRWQFGIEHVCQTDREVSCEPPSRMPVVACMVRSTFQHGLSARHFVRSTYGKSCDTLQFYIATDSQEEQADLGEQDLVDLGSHFPQMLVDGSDAPKQARLAHKALHIFRHAGRVLLRQKSERVSLRAGVEPQWFCLLDDDTYFSPSNFRRLVAERRWNADDAMFTGSLSHWLKHGFPNLVFTFAPAVCLSQAALLRLSAHLETVPYDPEASASPGRSQVTAQTHSAAPPASSHFSVDMCHFGGEHDDVMLAICMKELGLVPTRSEDARGRAAFLPVELEDVDDFGPLHSPACEPAVYNMRFIAKHHNISDGDIVVQRYYYWKNRVSQYIRCFDGEWASPFPVAFHLHRKNWSKGYEIHQVLTSGSCPACGKYVPRLWSC